MDESRTQSWEPAWRPGDATPTTPPYVPSRHTDPGMGPLTDVSHAHDADLVHAAEAAARRRELDHERDEARAHAASRAFRIVDVLFFIVYALLAARFVLVLLGARPDVSFVRFVDAVSGPFFAPFNNIVASPTFGAGHVVSLPIIIAIVAYAILHAIINAVIRAIAVAPRRTAVV